MRRSTSAAQALRVIAVASCLLAIYIVVQVTVMFSEQSHPGHSILGIVWLALTVLAMFALAAGKQRPVSGSTIRCYELSLE